MVATNRFDTMFEFAPYHILFVAIGIVTILAHWLPRFVSGREPASSALLIGLGCAAFAFIPGIPAAIDPVVNPGIWERVSELCVIVGLFGVGLRIDKLRPWGLWRPTARLLFIAMPLTIIATALLGAAFAGMTLAGALLLGAVLAPTDPVLAGDVQVGRPLEGGEHPVRFALTTEAGLNDGLAFPFVYLALAIAADGTGGEVFAEWLWRDVGYRIVVGVAGGIGVGWLLGRVLFVWPTENALARTEAGVVAIAGVLLAYGVTELAEGYGFIAAFVAGIVLRRAESTHEFNSRLHSFSENIELAVTAVLLVALGAALPVLLSALNWAGAGIALALILVVRPLIGWLSLGKAMPSPRERLVVAFYGVRGVGSIYYLSYAGSHVDFIDKAQLWAIIAFTVLISTIVHGFTAGIAVERATAEAEPLAAKPNPIG